MAVKESNSINNEGSTTVLNGINGVTYVEPNIDSVGTYDISSGSRKYRYQKSPDLSDFCIAVDLEVEVKGRTFNGKSNSNSQVYKLSWQNSEGGDGHINFFNGSRVYIDNSKSQWVNTLTTNYTNTFYDDLKNTETSTNEMFGIKGIDIQYNNFMVPEVSIEFCDVRGASLFALEEFRHCVTSSKSNIEGIADNSIQGSFFKCFFTFPYPKFTLRVKGFYGQMVSYELTCSDFRAKFDSQTGNFNVNTTFVGYAFSFLEDVMVNCLTAAPYCDYLGKDYWQKKINDGVFKLTNKDGSTAPMPTMAEIVADIQKIKQKAQDLKENGGVDIDAAATAAGVDAEAVKSVVGTDTNLSAAYDDFLSSSSKAVGLINKKNEDTIITVGGTDGNIGNGCKGFVVIAYNDEVNDAFSQIRDSEFAKLEDAWNKSNTKLRGEQPYFIGNQSVENLITEEGSIVGGFPSSTRNGNIKILSDKLIRKAKSKALSNGSKTCAQRWYDWENSKFWLFIAGGAAELGSSDTEDEQQANEAIDREAIKEATTAILQFEPTVENVTKIMMAHFDTFAYMVSKCCGNIIDSQRTMSMMNISPVDFPDIKTVSTSNKDGNTTVDNTVIPPFPRVTKEITQGEATKREDSWVGDGSYGDADKWEEVKLVEQILYAIEEMKKALTATVSEDSSGISGMTCSVPVPLALYDLTMTNNENPFGNPDISNIYDVLGHIIVRGFGLLSSQNYGDTNMSLIGRLDASNFLHFVHIEGTPFASMVSDKSLTGNEILQRICGKNCNNTGFGEGRRPWSKLCSENKGLLYNNINGNLGFGGFKAASNKDIYDEAIAYAHEDGENEVVIMPNHHIAPEGVIPVKNWTFDGITKQLKNTYGIPQNFSSFVSSSERAPFRGSNGKQYTEDKENLFYIYDSLDAITYIRQTVSQISSNGGDEGKKIQPSWVTQQFDGSKLMRKYDFGDSDEYRSHVKKPYSVAAFTTPKKPDAYSYDKTNGAVTISSRRFIPYFSASMDIDGSRNCPYGTSLFANPYFYFEDWKNENRTIRSYVDMAYIFVSSQNSFFERSDSNIFKSYYDKPTINYAAKADVLAAGAVALAYKRKYIDKTSNKLYNNSRITENYLKKAITNGRLPRLTYIYSLIDYFEKWANSEFKRLVGSLTLYRGKNGEYLDSICQILAMKYPHGFNESKCSEIVSEYFDKTVFNKAYLGILTNSRGSNMVLVHNPDNAVLKNFTADLLRPCAIVMTTKFNDSRSYRMSHMSPRLVASYTGMSNYLDGFMTVLRENGSSVSNASTEVGQTEDPEDLKVGVYNYIKLLYDKWMAGNLDSINTEWSIPNLFEGENRYFHFIDSFYNKIGNQLYVNIETVADAIYNCQTTNGYTLLSLLSDVYAQNKLIILCIQNFKDLTEEGAMQDMFTPIPYIDCADPQNHPNFIVMYPYEASSHLDMNESDYADDGFMLNNAATLPSMITRKNPDSYKIPAFGVSYGSQYQSYFSDVEVSMETPMVTEQSLKAKFNMIGGSTTEETGDGNNGQSQTMLGQDLYTIYANNSYTCTLTMMGCAWVQPMMYFVLLNVPMFRGSYMIMKVTHHIEPGKMTTQITGVRMAKTSTRFVQSFMAGGAGSGSLGEDAIEQFENANAAISNDCPYSFVSPLGGDGEDFSAELGQLAKNFSAKGCNNITSNMTVLEALSRIVACEWGTTGSSEDDIGNYSIAQVLYNRRGLDKGYKVSIFHPKQFADVSSSPKFNDSVRDERWPKLAPIIRNVWKGGAAPYLVGKPCVGGRITLPQVQKMYQYINPNNEQYLLRSSWYKGSQRQYTTNGKGQYQLAFYSSPDSKKSNGFTVSSIQKKTTKVSKAQSLAEGLFTSVQSTLATANKYSSVKLAGTPESQTNSYGWLSLSAHGDKSMNAAIFDIVQYTYNDWFDKLYWVIHGGSVNSNPSSILVHVKDNKGGKRILGVASSYTLQSLGNLSSPGIAKIYSEKNLNENLRLSLIKRYKKLMGYKDSANDIMKIKAEFVSMSNGNISNDAIRKMLELDKDVSNDSVQDCTSLAGYPNGGGGTITLGAGGTLKKGANGDMYVGNFDVTKAVTWLRNNASSESQHQCARNVKRAMVAGGISGVIGIDAFALQNYMQSYGFNLIAQGNSKSGEQELKLPQIQAGDICLQFYGNANGRHGHTTMYCGPDLGWISDFTQNHCKSNSSYAMPWKLYRHKA